MILWSRLAGTDWDSANPLSSEASLKIRAHFQFNEVRETLSFLLVNAQ